MHSFAFAKCHNLGNDFILIDDRPDEFPVSAKLVQKLCQPHLGIGADGLILLQTSKSADFKMRLFNSDGSEAKSCGNGLACLALFIQNLKLLAEQKNHSQKSLPKQILSTEEDVFTIETLAGQTGVVFQKGSVTLQMPDPKILKKELKIAKGKEIKRETSFFYVDSGVEHAVTFVGDLSGVDVDGLGRTVSHLTLFQPRGVNVDFAQLASSGIDLRVYEKGVEAETLACGTGAIATAIAAFYLYNIKPPILINFKHGSLKVDFTIKKNIIKKVKLIAFPNWIYSGNFLLD